jgi:hypothetical protein
MSNSFSIAIFIVVFCFLCRCVAFAILSWKDLPLATTFPLNSRANDSNAASPNVPIVTSFKYNPPGIKVGRGEYVDYTFGDKAMLYTDVDRKKLRKESLTEREFQAAKAQFKNAFSHFREVADMVPACSVDMLAYVVPTEPAGAKLSKSFHDHSDHNPIGTMFTGTSQLAVVSSAKERDENTTSLSTESWKCYYRNMWRNRYYNLHQLVLYCPLPTLNDCQTFERASSIVTDGSGRKEIQLKMTMTPIVPKWLIRQLLKYPDWVSNFKAYIHLKEVYEASIMRQKTSTGKKAEIQATGAMIKARSESPLGSKKNTDVLTASPPSSRASSKRGMVVCTTAPYVTSIKDGGKKQSVTNTIVSEFVRYYLRLGFRVIFYDRAGGHMSPQLKQQLAESNESQKGPNAEDRKYFVYKDFTMLEALVSTSTAANSANKSRVRDNTTEAVARNQQYYDNTDNSGRKWQLRFTTDVDKIVTFSQCRHEAQAMWGIGNVLVVDFDEFLVCPAPDVPITAAGQRQYIQSLVAKESALGRSFLLFHQRIPANTTAALSQVACMLEKMKTAGGSIFQCYADYANVAFFHSVKSMYLGFQCPHTSFHQSANFHSTDRGFDCGDGNYVDVPTCGLMHLSTNPAIFENPCRRIKEMSQEKVNKMRQPNSSELYRIIMNS